MSNRINIILGDAKDVNIVDEYDLIFIDASKGNNINFFNKYSKNLKSYGIIITDNLLFHGLVRDEKLIKTKNQRGIVKKIKQFIEIRTSKNIFNNLVVYDSGNHSRFSSTPTDCLDFFDLISVNKHIV